ncbi:MAG TPA: hypothetical protein VM098_09245, partial [Phycisphaerae bacterium]|nr:hypothetical protein [Phycisphaerae bacterium]
MPEIYTSRTLREMTRVVASRFAGMVMIFVIVVAAVWVSTYYAPKEYRSDVPLLAEPVQPVEVMPRPAPSSLREQIALFVDTQREIILCDDVLSTALLRLAGAEPPSVLPEPAPAPAQLGAEGQQAPETAPETKPAEELTVEQIAAWELHLRQWDKKVQEYKDGNARYLEKVRNRVQVITPGGPDAAFTQVFKIRVDWPEERVLAAGRGVDSRELAAERAHAMAQYVLDAYQLYRTRMEFNKARTEASSFRSAPVIVAKTQVDEARAGLNEFLSRPEVSANLLHLTNVVGSSGLETGLAANVRARTLEMNDLQTEMDQLECYKTKVLAPEIEKTVTLDNLYKKFVDVQQRIAKRELAGVEEDLSA